MRTDSEVRSDISFKTAVCCLAKGRRLPAFLETLDFRSRIVAVQAIERYMPTPMSDELFKTLVTDPGVMMNAMFESTAIILDNMAVVAHREMANWSTEDLAKTMMDAGHLAADIAASKVSRG